MAHDRKRHFEPVFNRLMNFSPIVGVFGHRQVGKSTFIAKAVKNYHTLDDAETLLNLRSGAKRWIQQHAGSSLAIDECQLEPPLFPALKEWIRTRKKPGQFVLSGSVRFTSRKVIRESLAGRMATIEMLPFSASEAAHLPLSTIVPHLLSRVTFERDLLRIIPAPHSQGKALQTSWNDFLENGGLPGLCFIRDKSLQKAQLFFLHDLMLSRDLQLVENTRVGVETLKKWLGWISRQSMEIYNAAEAQRFTGISQLTQRKLIRAFEAIFLLRRIPAAGRNRYILLLEDQLEERIYSGGKNAPIKTLESALYRNIRNQFAYHLDYLDVQFEHYLTRDHARVPWVIRNATSSLGLIVIQGEQPNLSEQRAAASFLKNEGNAKVAFLSPAKRSVEVLNSRELVCSILSVI